MIAELFSNRKRFVVPLFQRPYVWSEGRQWAPLWLDIVDRAEAVAAAGANAVVSSHFLGAVVTVPLRSFGVGVPIAELVDGQQRLTTLQLILHAFRDVCRELGVEDIADALDVLVVNQKPWGSTEDHYKVWPTNLDQQVYACVLAAGSAAAVEAAFPLHRKKYKRTPEPRPRLAEAYLCYSRWIREHLKDQPSPTAANLYTAVVNHLQVVHLELEAGEDPQAIFEALNGRGEPLTPADLIKNYLFRHVKGDQQRAYDAYWRELDEKPAEDRLDAETRFWRRKQRQGRLSRSRLDLFLFQYLTMRKGAEVLIGNLFRDFEAWHLAGGEAAEATLADMRAHTEHFARRLAPSGRGRLATFARRVRTLDTSTVYPVVLYLQGQGASKVAAGELEPILEIVESYLVRRAVCRLSSNAYNHDFLQLLKRLRSAERVDRALVRDHFVSLKGEHHAWPSDEALRTAWRELPAYQMLGPARTAMILLALEDALSSRFHEEVMVLSSLTVEHVMPQKWSDHWPLVGVDGPAAEAAGARRDEVVHSFGNLTLITGTLNSSVKNAAFAVRRPELTQKSLLKLNVWFQDVESWDEGAIARRGEALFDVAKRVWPGPSDGPSIVESRGPTATVVATPVEERSALPTRVESQPTANQESFTEVIRTAVSDVLGPDWRVGQGAKTLLVQSLGFREAVEAWSSERAVDAGDLQLKLWLDQPVNDRARMAVEFTGGPRGWTSAQSKELRGRLTAGLRLQLEGGPHATSSTGNNIAVRLDYTVADDTALHSDIERTRAFVTFVDGRVNTWTADGLRDVLGRSAWPPTGQE